MLPWPISESVSVGATVVTPVVWHAWLCLTHARRQAHEHRHELRRQANEVRTRDATAQYEGAVQFRASLIPLGASRSLQHTQQRLAEHEQSEDVRYLGSRPLTADPRSQASFTHVVSTAHTRRAGRTVRSLRSAAEATSASSRAVRRRRGGRRCTHSSCAGCGTYAGYRNVLNLKFLVHNWQS